LSCQVTPEVFRRTSALFPTGVAILTTLADDNAPHGLTVNSFSSLSLDPPLVLVAIDRVCSVLKTFESRGYFAINILSDNQRDLSVRFSELPEGRFSGVAWTPGETECPIIDGVLGVLECRTVQVIDAGDHRALIGEVVAASAGQGSPLVFFNSTYTQLR
jgi:flavin reductase (DIM6/NTAB) family NADH-FMN oxidoreductase RutF